MRLSQSRAERKRSTGQEFEFLKRQKTENLTYWATMQKKRISVDFLKYLSQPWSQGLGKLILNRGILFLLTPCAVCAMLTKHILSFSNIEIGNGVADTYTFGIYYGYDFIFLRIAHFPTEFVHGCSGSLSFALLFHSFITERVLSIFKLPVLMNFLSILSKCTHAWHGCMALFLQL